MKPARANFRSFVGIVVLVLTTLGCASVPRRPSPALRYRPVEKRAVPVAAVATAPTTPVPATPAPPRPEPGETSGERSGAMGRKLQRGDRLEVSLRAIPQPETFKVVVDDGGNINMPFLGDVPVAGKTAAEAQKLIEQLYIDQQIYKFITVIIVPPESEYSVSGEVQRPASYMLTRDLTLLQALSRAGWFTEYADPTKVKIFRQGRVTTHHVERIQKGREQDPIIEPGDIIEVPRSWY